MCYGCWEEEGKHDVVNEATLRAAQLADEIYKFSCVGGNAHVVVDDWNISDSTIEWNLSVLVENLHEASPEQLSVERAFLEAMLAMSIEERNSAMAIHEGYLTPETP